VELPLCAESRLALDQVSRIFLFHE
jgi:hypothetical protein